MSKDLVLRSDPSKGKFLVYEAEDGRVKIDVRLEDETVWLTQQLMADLFQTSQQSISLHIQNIYEEDELAQKATYKKYLSVHREGQQEAWRMIPTWAHQVQVIREGL
ncbi:MAG: virulence protein [Proteobacteria bacterium]|nr:virulence protein [Pseudomonadota bacterium]